MVKSKNQKFSVDHFIDDLFHKFQNEKIKLLNMSDIERNEYVSALYDCDSFSDFREDILGAIREYLEN